MSGKKARAARHMQSMQSDPILQDYLKSEIMAKAARKGRRPISQSKLNAVRAELEEAERAIGQPIHFTVDIGTPEPAIEEIRAYLRSVIESARE